MRFEVDIVFKDGDWLVLGDVVFWIIGCVWFVLYVEWVVFNFLCYLFGIVIVIVVFVDWIVYIRVDIVCICKIILGLWVFEKYVVKCGGGVNYWFGFDDVILIKDNYIVVVGGVVFVIESVWVFVGYLVKIEVEVDMFD